MPDKLTDSEIVKALECCQREYDKNCKECFYNKYSITGCSGEMLKDALDLINRLQAENERLNIVHHCIDKAILGNQEFAIADEYLIAYQNALEHLYNNINLKAEAYKEFAEKSNSIIDSLLEKYSVTDFEEFKAVCQVLRGLRNDIDNILKELVGE